MGKGIGDLVTSLNAKAAAAGEDIRAVHVTIDATWGDNCGVAILGTGNRERAVAYVQAYYRKHLAPKRTYNAQYSYTDKGDCGTKGRVISLVYYPCAD